MSLRASAVALLQDASPAEWSVVAATVTFATLLAAVAYRAFLHPLHRYPGPTLYAISSLPRTWHTITGGEVHLMYDLHMKYGPVVRIGPNELSYVDPRAIKDIYGHRKGGQVEFVKDPDFFNPPLNGAEDILRSSGEAHARMRKTLSHSFSDRALKSQESLLKTHIGKLVGILASNASKEAVDLARLYNATTFDIMADLTFSAPLGLLEGNLQWEDWVHAITEHIRGMTFMRMLRHYKALYHVVAFFLPRSLAEERKKTWDYAVERVDARLAQGSEKPDFWAEVLRRDRSMTVGEMHANAEVFMAAGTETTATLLSGLTYYLATHPDKFEKLKEEIRTAMPNEENVTVERLQGLRYLYACIEETFRMYPPAAVGLRRVTPAEGAKIGDDWVAGGTKVTWQQWPSYRYPAHFARPDEFIPERWLETESGEFANDRRDILQPFSYGPRNCIGKNLAYHEIRVVIASIIRSFDVELCPESKDWRDQKVFSTWSKPALMCKLTPVNA